MFVVGDLVLKTTVNLPYHQQCSLKPNVSTAFSKSRLPSYFFGALVHYFSLTTFLHSPYLNGF